MRLVDADVLKADYGMAEDCENCETGYRSCAHDYIYSKMDFCGWLDDAPTVDAVPVIRCKDCKHNPNPPEYGNADCDIFDGMTDQMGYCHWAEMREDERPD